MLRPNEKINLKNRDLTKTRGTNTIHSIFQRRFI